MDNKSARCSPQIMNCNVVNKDEILKNFEKYEPLIRKYSYTIKGFEDDLYSECKIAFLKCLTKFKFNKEEFIVSYMEYNSGNHLTICDDAIYEPINFHFNV